MFTAKPAPIKEIEGLMVEAWKVLGEEREACPDLCEAVMKDRSFCGVT